MNKYLKLALAFIVVLAVSGAFYGYSYATRPQAIASEHASASVSIEGLYQGKVIPLVQNETVLQALENLNTADQNIGLETKIYPGLGVLVTGIGPYKNGDGKYWQYQVNGVMPQVGADKYTLKNGDSVEWFFAASQE